MYCRHRRGVARRRSAASSSQARRTPKIPVQTPGPPQLIGTDLTGSMGGGNSRDKSCRSPKSKVTGRPGPVVPVHQSRYGRRRADIAPRGSHVSRPFLSPKGMIADQLVTRDPRPACRLKRLARYRLEIPGAVRLARVADAYRIAGDVDAGRLSSPKPLRRWSCLNTEG